MQDEVELAEVVATVLVLDGVVEDEETDVLDGAVGRRRKNKGDNPLFELSKCFIFSLCSFPLSWLLIAPEQLHSTLNSVSQTEHLAE